MSSWQATLDAILPEPGIDLGILSDPAALADATVVAMWKTAKRLRASADDFELVLDVLFSEIAS